MEIEFTGYPQTEREAALVKYIEQMEASRSTGCYVVEHADYDGYNQRFAKIGDWKTVEAWAKDGSIRKGDTVYLLVESIQPEIAETI